MTRLFTLAPEPFDLGKDDPKGSYRVWARPNVVKVNICCPGCGQVGGLDHHIAADGTISPSLVCPFEPCTFHEYGKLEGWTHGALDAHGQRLPSPT